MKPSIFLQSFTILFFISFFSTPGFSREPRGKEKTVADDRYGVGGTRTTFSAGNYTIILFKDPNKNRRLLQNIVTYPGVVRTNAFTYFNCQGQRDFFVLETIGENGSANGGLRENFSNGNRESAAAWLMQNGTRLNYNYNSRTNEFETGGQFNEDKFLPGLNLCPKIPSAAHPLKFQYTLVGKQHYTFTEVSDKYSEGKETTEAYQDYDEYDGNYRVVEKKAYDKHGVLRHDMYSEYYPDGCVYESHAYYDCHGNLQYREYTWYDDEGYEYEYCDEYYKGGEKTAGYYFYDGNYYGERETYNPATRSWERGWHPGFNKPEGFEPDIADCPDSDSWWDHHFYSGPSLILEDASPERFSTYGFEFSYQYNFCQSGGLIGDLGLNFGSHFDVKYTKLTGLVGSLYYPFKTANLRNDLMFSVHALIGASYLLAKYSNGNYSSSSSDTYFTGCAGIGLDKKLNDRFGLGLRADFIPVFGKGNTASNLRFSAGIRF